MVNVSNSPISEAQRKDLLRLILENELDITTSVALVRDQAQYTNSIAGAEPVAGYAARLNGYIRERRGMIAVLRTLHLEVKWEGEHPVDIVPMEI